MPLEHTQLIDKDPAGVIDHADGSVTPVKLSDPFTFTATPFTPAEAPTQDYHVANKAYVDGLGAAGQPTVALSLSPRILITLTQTNPTVAVS